MSVDHDGSGTESDAESDEWSFLAMTEGTIQLTVSIGAQSNIGLYLWGQPANSSQTGLKLFTALAEDVATSISIPVVSNEAVYFSLVRSTDMDPVTIQYTLTVGYEE